MKNLSHILIIVMFIILTIGIISAGLFDFLNPPLQQSPFSSPLTILPAGSQWQVTSPSDDWIIEIKDKKKKDTEICFYPIKTEDKKDKQTFYDSEGKKLKDIDDSEGKKLKDIDEKVKKNKTAYCYDTTIEEYLKVNPVVEYLELSIVSYIYNDFNVNATLQRCNEERTDCELGYPALLIIDTSRLKFGAIDQNRSEDTDYKYIWESNKQIKQDKKGYYIDGKTTYSGTPQQRITEKVRIDTSDICNQQWDAYESESTDMEGNPINITLYNSSAECEYNSYSEVVSNHTCEDMEGNPTTCFTTHYFLEVVFTQPLGLGGNITIDPAYSIDEFRTTESIDTDVQQENNFSHLEINDVSPYDSLVAYYPFDVTKGGATWNSSKINNGLVFDGVDEYVNCGNDSSLKPSKQITVSAWINANVIANAHIAGITGTGGSSNENYLLWMRSNGNFSMYINGQMLQGNVSASTGTWYHIVGIFDADGGSNNKKIYVDGVLSGQETQAADIHTDDFDFEIGRYYTGAYDFNGAIDEVMIFNRSLTANEISALYNNQSVGTRVLENDTSLVSYWYLDETGGIGVDDSKDRNDGVAKGYADTNVYDYSSSNNDGVAYNEAHQVDGIYGKAMEFDGDGDYVNMGNNPNFNFGTGEFTVSAWAYISNSVGTGAGDFHVLVGKTGLFGPTSQEYDISIRSGLWRFEVYNGSALNDFAQSVFTKEKWTHVVGTKNSTNGITLYIDGVAQSDTLVVPGNVSNLNNFRIGSRTGGDYSWNGSIDEVMIFNTSLTQQQITDIYNNQSARFKTNGTQELKQFNITSGNNTVNVTTNNFQELFGSSLELRLGAWDVSLGYNDSIDGGDVGYSLNDGLVGYWHFDNISGYENDTHVMDWSGSGNNGTFNKNGTGAMTSDGVYDGGIFFDGEGDYVSFSKVMTNPTEFSMSGWFKAKNTNAEERPFTHNNDEPYVSLRFNQGDTANKLLVLVYDGVDGTGISSNSYTLTDWNHITVTAVESSRYDLYVNGVLVASDTDFGTFASIDIVNNFIGAARDVSTFFNGSIDEVLIYNRSLSASEIEQLYIKGRAKWNYTGYSGVSTSESVFAISENTTNILPEYKFNAGGSNGTNQFYSPLLEAGMSFGYDLDKQPPTFDFTAPTLDNGSSTTNTSVEINVSITERYLDELIYNWNGTNFTLYDDSLVGFWGSDWDDNRWVGGKVGGGFEFDGEGDWVDVVSTSGDELNPLNNITISAWVKPNTVIPTYQWVVTREGVAYQNYVFGLEDNDLHFNFGTGSANHNAITPDIILIDTWQHIVATYDGSNIKTYLNGAVVNTTSETDNMWQGNANVVIGERTRAGTSNPFNGSIDEVMIFNRSLTATEISDLYNNQTIGNRILEDDSGLVSYWHMEDNLGYNFEDSKGGNNGTLNINDSATIDDFSSQSNDGTINGNAYVSGGKYGAGMSFDGDGDGIVIADSGTSSLDISNEITVSAWIKHRHSSAVNARIAKKSGSYSLQMFSGDDDVGFEIHNGTTYYQAKDTIGTANIKNIWTYYVGTYNGSDLKIYRDGMEIASTLVSGSITLNDDNLDIGYTEYFNGSIDEVLIYNRSLTANEIYQLYVSNLYKYDTDKWGLYVNQSKNASDGLDVGDYTYYVWGNDIHGNNNKSETRSVTIESGAVADNPPTVTLSLPPDNNVSEQGIVTFEINSTDDNELSNLTLYIWNSSEGIIITNFTTINGTSNSTNLTYNFQFDNLTTWNGYVCDNASQCSWATANFTLNITTDSIPPTFTNIHNISIYSNNSVDSYFNATDESTFDSFAINWTTTFNINQTGYLSNTTGLSNQFYYINVTINDSVNNIASQVIWVSVSDNDLYVPNVTLIAPPDDTANATTSFNFTANLSDDVGIQNASLYIYNDTGDLINQTWVDIVGDNVLKYTVGVVVYLSVGIYHWFYEVFDIRDKVSYPTANFSLNVTDEITPGIVINYPGNASYGLSSLQFNITATDNHVIQRCWYTLNGGTDNTTMSYDGTDWLHTNTSISNGGYLAQFYCNDTNNNINNSENVSFSIKNYNVNFLFPEELDKVRPDRFFDNDINVSCYGTSCGETNTSLYHAPWSFLPKQAWNKSDSSFETGFDLTTWSDIGSEGTTNISRDNIDRISYSGDAGIEYVSIIIRFNITINISYINNMTFRLKGFGKDSDGFNIFNTTVWNGSQWTGLGESNSPGKDELETVIISGFDELINDTNLYIKVSNLREASVSHTNLSIYFAEVEVDNNDYKLVNSTFTAGGAGSVSFIDNAESWYGDNDCDQNIWDYCDAGDGFVRRNVYEYSGAYSVRFYDHDSETDLLTEQVDLTGINNANITFYQSCLNSMDPGDSIKLKIYNGSWNVIKVFNESNCFSPDFSPEPNDYTYEYIDISSYTGTKVNITWSAKCDAANEVFFYDEFKLTGEGTLGVESFDIFYTERQNPNTTTITTDNSKVIYMPVNATGYDLYTRHSLMATANRTADMSDNNYDKVKVVIAYPDTVDPILTILSPEDETITTNATYINVSSEDDLDWCAYSLDGATNVTMNKSFLTHYYGHTSNISDGSHNITVVCNDSDNNQGFADVIFAVDTVPPIVSLITPTNNLVRNGTNVNFTFTPTPNGGTIDTCQLYTDETGSWAINQTTSSLTDGEPYSMYNNMSNGTYQWNIFCNESNGNTDWSQQGNFTVIINNPPTQTTPLLNAGNVNNETDQNITCFNQSTSDPELDSVINIYNWNLDNESLTVLNAPFEGYGGIEDTYAKDYSGNNHNISNYNVQWNRTNGRVGGAYYFDDGYFALDYNLNRSGILNNFTICLWFNTSDSGDMEDNYAFIDFDENEYFSFNIRADNGRIGFVSTNVTGEKHTMQSGTSSLNDNQWHHACISFDAGKVDDKKIYVDGVLSGSVSSGGTSSFIGTGTNRYGFIGDTSIADTFNGMRGGWNYEGWIDELIWFNRSLSDTQISRLYNDYVMNTTHNRTIVSGETIANEVWQCDVTPNDGYQNGNNQTSNNLVVIAQTDDSPTVTLNEPSDQSINNTFGDVTFNCSVTDDLGLSNITLYIWNSSGEDIYVNTIDITGISNSTTWTFDFQFYNNTEWNCKAYDTANNYDWGDNNWHMNISAIVDDTLPVFTNPRNITHSVNNSLSESFAATDDFGIDTYILNDTTYFNVNSTTGLVTNNTNLSRIEIHYLNISVNDTSNNVASFEFWIDITTTQPAVITGLSIDDMILGYNINPFESDNLNIAMGYNYEY